MSDFGFYVIPGLIGIILMCGIIAHVPVFDSFLQGASDGIASTFSIAPSLIGLITAVTMLKSSGALDLFTSFISPLFNLIGIPAEVMPLALLRPISGSGSIALLDHLLTSHGPDSIIGRLASILMGSTETMFYTITVYFGAVRIKNSKHAVPSALIADFAALIAAAVLIKKIF